MRKRITRTKELEGNNNTPNRHRVGTCVRFKKLGTVKSVHLGLSMIPSYQWHTHIQP